MSRFRMGLHAMVILVMQSFCRKEILCPNLVRLVSGAAHEISRRLSRVVQTNSIDDVIARYGVGRNVSCNRSFVLHMRCSFIGDQRDGNCGKWQI